MLPKILYGRVLFWVPDVWFICWRLSAQFGCSFSCSFASVFVFQTFQMSRSYISLNHALRTMPRQKLWTGEIHRKSQQFYCQGDFSWISLTEEFLTSYPFRWGIQLEMASVTPWKCMGWLHVGYLTGKAFYCNSYVHIRSALTFLGDCITMGILALFHGNGTAAAEHKHLCHLLCSSLPVLIIFRVLWRLCLLRGLSWGPFLTSAL